MPLGRYTAWLDSSGDQAKVEDRQGLGFVQMGKSRWDAGLDQAHDGKPHSVRSGCHHDAQPEAPWLD